MTAGRGVSKKLDVGGQRAIARGSIHEVLNLPRIIYDPVTQEEQCRVLRLVQRESVGTGGGIKNDCLNVSFSSLNAHACDVREREVRRIAPPGDTFGGPIFRYMPVSINWIEIPGDVVGVTMERKSAGDGDKDEQFGFHNLFLLLATFSLLLSSRNDSQSKIISFLRCAVSPDSSLLDSDVARDESTVDGITIAQRDRNVVRSSALPIVSRTDVEDNSVPAIRRSRADEVGRVTLN